MTHTLRALHAGIIVGVGTILADDPSLNTRFVSGPSPYPIIIDTSLKTPIHTKVVQRHAIICCHSDGLTTQQQQMATIEYVKKRIEELKKENTTTATTTATNNTTTDASTPSFRFDALVAAGAIPLICPTVTLSSASSSSSSSIHVSLPLTCALLGSLFSSLMIEGGAAIITNMLEQVEQTNIVDTIIITIAPMLVSHTTQHATNNRTHTHT